MDKQNKSAEENRTMNKILDSILDTGMLDGLNLTEKVKQAMRKFSDKKLTTLQQANAELEKQNISQAKTIEKWSNNWADAKSKLDDIEKYNVELVVLLKSCLKMAYINKDSDLFKAIEQSLIK